jgi:hypothetical protein
LLVIPAARFAFIQWGRGAGGISVTPEPKIPFGGTPTRTRNARLPGSMFRCRPHDQFVSKWPRRASLRRSAGISGQFQ